MRALGLHRSPPRREIVCSDGCHKLSVPHTQLQKKKNKIIESNKTLFGHICWVRPTTCLRVFPKADLKAMQSSRVNPQPRDTHTQKHTHTCEGMFTMKVAGWDISQPPCDGCYGGIQTCFGIGRITFQTRLWCWKKVLCSRMHPEQTPPVMRFFWPGGGPCEKREQLSRARNIKKKKPVVKALYK